LTSDTGALEILFAHSKRKNDKPLTIEIRHLGFSWFSEFQFRCTNIRENTIASLQTAAEHGADFVEFDVQLSKDLIPVLFHDFHVNIGLQQKSKKGGDLTTLKIPVKDLTLKQLHELKVH